MIKTDIAIIGSGPGGYTAAFRAADLGKKIILVERYKNLGGVCLNVGCIPSKTLLHTAQIINEAKAASSIGIDFSTPKISITNIIKNKEKIVAKLTNGIKALAKARQVKIVTGEAKFISNKQITINNGEHIIEFKNCIIAAGSSVNKIPMFDFADERIMDSTSALEIRNIPKSLLIVGGGIIGLEMATVYNALGSEISIVEQEAQLITNADSDIVMPLLKRIKKQYKNIYLNTKVTNVQMLYNGIKVSFSGGNAPQSEIFDKILVSVGRYPNGKLIDAEKAGVNVNKQGFIPVDRQMKTNIENIFAIGDIVSQPMLAHKATYEAKIAAEVICGYKSCFDALTIASVAYTDPEVAWSGKTEKQLKDSNTPYKKGVFPWAASGRNLSIGRSDGISKALFDATTGRIIGMGICGSNAGELIAEATLAIEMGCDMTDIALTIHPHPTLSETITFAAEMAEGTITDLLPPKK